MLNMFNNTLNSVFFHDLELADPEVYMDAVGADLGETMGNIIAKSYQFSRFVSKEFLSTLSCCGTGVGQADSVRHWGRTNGKQSGRCNGGPYRRCDRGL